MIQKPFDRIERADLDSLVANQVMEGRTLEYKLALPGGTESDKKEFLADVSSFANAAGGDLLYGVDEVRGAGGRPTGVPSGVPGLATSTNTGSEILRLEAIIRDGVEPRIAGIQMREITGFAGPVLFVRIPQSFARPHVISYQSWSRFYSRNSGGKYMLDVGEIRSAFALSESLPERIRSFRSDRLARIISDDTPVILRGRAKLILQIVPIPALATPGFRINLQELSNIGGLPLPFFDNVAPTLRFNLDGLLSSDPEVTQRVGVAYSQAFRNGAAEFADVWTLAAAVKNLVLPATSIEKRLIRALRGYLAIARQLQIPVPLVVLPSILGMMGCRIETRDGDASPGTDRADLILPDVMVEDLNQEPSAVLRPSFDAMWQAAGWPQSSNYDQNGVWTERY